MAQHPTVQKDSFGSSFFVVHQGGVYCHGMKSAAHRHTADNGKAEIGYQKVLRMTRNGILLAIKIGKSYYYQRTQLQKLDDINFSRVACARIKVG